MTEPDLSEFQEISEADELRRMNGELARKLQKAKHKTEELRDETYRAARDAFASLGPLPPVPKPKLERRKGKPEVALWHLTDWQLGKKTPTYNTQVCYERIFRYCDKAAKLTEIQRADHPVRDAVLMFGGDILESVFQFPKQPYEIDMGLYGQFTMSSRLVAMVVRRALAIYDHVEVVEEDGNHGRIGDKTAPTAPGDNFDRMIYFTARLQLEDEKRLTWPERDPNVFPEDIQHVEIGNYRALMFHGNEIGKYGNAAPKTVVEHVAKWKSGAHPWPFQDAYLGHKHRHMDLDLPDGKGMVYMTGAPESTNKYAMDGLASSAQPSQRLHFIEPEAGMVTVPYKVQLV